MARSIADMIAGRVGASGPEDPRCPHGLLRLADVGYRPGGMYCAAGCNPETHPMLLDGPPSEHLRDVPRETIARAHALVRKHPGWTSELARLALCRHGFVHLPEGVAAIPRVAYCVEATCNPTLAAQIAARGGWIGARALYVRVVREPTPVSDEARIGKCEGCGLLVVSEPTDADPLGAHPVCGACDARFLMHVMRPGPEPLIEADVQKVADGLFDGSIIVDGFGDEPAPRMPEKLWPGWRADVRTEPPVSRTPGHTPDCECPRCTP